MLNLATLKLFPFKSPQVYVPMNESQKYNIIFLSENSNFVGTYNRLAIRRQFVKKITMVGFNVPRFVVNMNKLNMYKSTNLMPTLRGDENTFVDATPFFDVLDTHYSKGSYLRPMVLSKAIGYLNQCKTVGNNKKNILLYHIDTSKSVGNPLRNRRAAVLASIAKLGDGRFPFDSVTMALDRGGSVMYSSLYNKEYSPMNSGRIIGIFKQIKPENNPDAGSDTQQGVEDSEDQPEKQSILGTIRKMQSDRFV